VSELEEIDQTVEVAAIDTGSIVQTSGYWTSEPATMGANVGYRLYDESSFMKAWCGVEGEENYLTIGVSGSPKLWLGLALRGRGDSQQYVTKYGVFYSNSGIKWSCVDSCNQFAANTDPDTIVRNDFDQPVIAAVVKVLVLEYNQHPCIRVEAYYKETCHWRCDTCAIIFDHTQCTVCSSSQGIESHDNGDGTFTCECGDQYYADQQAMICKRTFIFYFNF
jgi:hypothetical protein